MSQRLLIVTFHPDEAVSAIGFASRLGLPFDIAAFGGCPPANLGAETLWVGDEDPIPVAEAIVATLGSLVSTYSHIASVSSMRSKDVVARLAGKWDLAMVTDVVEIESPTVFKRPIVAGSIIATVEVLQGPVALTFRPAGFGKSTTTGQSNVAKLPPATAVTTLRTDVSSRSGSRPDLTQAKVIVSGGRPLKDASTFEAVIGGLADALSGAAGATRAAVDSGIAPNELQVGQTGKIVAPDLYIAAGISGSTQHMAGIKDSKIIVAINKDPDAPIFETADYGIVADLFDAIPELRKELGR